MITHITCVIFLLLSSTVAEPSLANFGKVTVENNNGHDHRSPTPEQQVDPISFASQIAQQLNEMDLAGNRLVKKSSSDIIPTVEASSFNLTDDASSLLRLKSWINSANSVKRKNPYPGIVFPNNVERQLNEDISDDLTKFEAYSKLIGQLMHSIVNKDLGLTAMQQKIDKTNFESTLIPVDSIVDAIADKIARKIDDIHLAIEITGERIEEIFKQQSAVNGSAKYKSCCDFYLPEFGTYRSVGNSNVNLFSSEHDLKLLNSLKLKELNALRGSKYQFDAHFNAWISKQSACDIADVAVSKRSNSFHFTPTSSNLTQQFALNLFRFPNFKWQYFMSLAGVHTEYPSYLPPNNYCFLHTINSEQINQRFSEHNDRNANVYPKRGHKAKSKKYDTLYHHRKAYNELSQYFAQRHQENLLATALPQHKLVVIVIDRGSALTDHQLNIAKSVAKFILNSLSHRDKVAIVDLTSDAHYPSSESCSSRLEMMFANPETKLTYSRYIDDLQRSHNSTNHYLGFRKAFDIVASNYHSYKAQINSEPEIFIPYISRGLLASLADARPVMELIAGELKNCSYTLVINCYALIDETKPIMYETAFLREVALMNFRKFNVESPPNHKIRPGIMVPLNNTEGLSLTMKGIYDVLNKPEPESYREIYLSLPQFDFISKDTHISLSKAFFYRDRFLGVVGVDISFWDFAEDIIHFENRSPSSYAFLMDAHSGKLLYHPAFAQHNRFTRHKTPHTSNKYNSAHHNNDYYAQTTTTSSFTNAEHLEQAVDFLSVKLAIMRHNIGSRTLRLQTVPMTRKNESEIYPQYDFANGHNPHQHYSTVTYHWRRIRSSSFVVVVAEYDGPAERDSSTTTATTNGDESQHRITVTNFTLTSGYRVDHAYVNHRLDILPNIARDDVHLCKHFNQLATTDSASLFLTSSVFENPYQFESDLDSIESLQGYMRYLTDGANSVPNPGLKKGIRGDVNLMSTMTDHWRELFDTAETSKYIVRKYIASASGSFMIYPGTLLDQSYEPRSRPWFDRAAASPGKLIFMSPYLDIGGAGYVVTLSQAILLRSSSESTVWAVMGVDLTLGYFHKIIDEMVPICNGNKSSCFIMDDFGTLIVHSSFLKPTLTAHIELQHITHKEPQMVNDLLNQKSFVRKFVCNNYNDRTIQRYYMFNSSMVGILTNIVQNDDSTCAKYKLISLGGTNAFFGIVNHTCDNSTTFCPCSLTDRLCLNCHRMEQTDCECPCECPLVMDQCSGDLIEKEDKNPTCPPLAETLQAPSVPKYLFDSIDSCINSECFNKHSESECKGVLTCEWCSMENGFRIKKPFCTNQNLCFGGIYGSKNPYMNCNHFYFAEEEKPASGQQIGPFTFIVLALFVAFIISVAYCFRQRDGSRYSSHAEHQILPHSNEANDHPDQNESCHAKGNYEAVVSLVHASVNPNFENLASPYQINTNYRRPRVQESDYGYSTMTPNDDSEPNSSIYIERPLAKTNKKQLNSFDFLNLSTATTTGAASEISNDDMSTLSSPSSSSSIGSSSQRLPPPPSRMSNKIRLKQKYVDQVRQTIVPTPLPTLKENSLLDDAVDISVN